MNPNIPQTFQAILKDAQTALDKLLSAAPAQDARAKADALIQHTLAKMGAVPRAEFEIQRDMLLALRERVAQLEQQLAAQAAASSATHKAASTTP
jgi:BMFP domain-containing protein YqiC